MIISKRSSSSSAFTLLELLVVVTVIVVLAAIMIPVLSMAKNASVRISCANNIWSISLASLSYAQGERGFFPLGDWSGRWPQVIRCQTLFELSNFGLGLKNWMCPKEPGISAGFIATDWPWYFTTGYGQVSYNYAQTIPYTSLVSVSYTYLGGLAAGSGNSVPWYSATSMHGTSPNRLLIADTFIPMSIDGFVMTNHVQDGRPGSNHGYVDGSVRFVPLTDMTNFCSSGIWHFYGQVERP